MWGSLFIMAFMIGNIAWAIYNWKQEWNYIEYVYSNPTEVEYKDYIVSVALLLGDILLTAWATKILGFDGVNGAAYAIFFSNGLSRAFFTPKHPKKIKKN